MKYCLELKVFPTIAKVITICKSSYQARVTSAPHVRCGRDKYIKRRYFQIIEVRYNRLYETVTCYFVLPLSVLDFRSLEFHIDTYPLFDQIFLPYFVALPVEEGLAIVCTASV